MSNTQSRTEYLRRIHKVQDYIEDHLNHTLVLDELADIAGFSKYHFHRIFTAITNESLLQYVNRIKLERAAFFLVHRPEITVTDIAYHFGFTDSAVFSRAFKHHYSLSPTQYRNQHSKNCKDPVENPKYNRGILNDRNGSDPVDSKANVEMVTVNEMRVIYVRYTGTYQGLATAMPGMMEKLYGFAMSHNLLEPGKTKILTIYHDNPEMTDENQLRTSLCMSIPNDAKFEENGDIGAVGHFEIYQHEYGAAWKYMYGEWLPNSGCQPRDAFPFEVYVSDPNANPQGKQFVDIYLPVEPLGKL
ncbi:AraC family transcriptional regulator [Paenibacillus sp. MZ04-78.2]|uniref:AraC family transcriptional regulator n=1 Tax=Paenibacillus sp. MZ04-78.2 TaxID=2962034 RepID=UPI0020B8E724|nr:GyrI-like domain-containing protein [Paenibacillus sp. MZ04-78.2]MCP3773786.1 AraC family transcriptional regulator [Paenibacillus sp. MZ04-78.2]